MESQSKISGAPLRAASIPLPSIETVARVATLLASSNERLLALQYSATNVALTEMAARQAELMKAMAKPGNALPWPYMHEANTRRIIEVMQDWFEILTETQAELVELMGESFSSVRFAAPAHTAPRTPFPAERRVTSVVINFPDRRRAVA